MQLHILVNRASCLWVPTDIILHTSSKQSYSCSTSNTAITIIQIKYSRTYIGIEYKFTAITLFIYTKAKFMYIYYA